MPPHAKAVLKDGLDQPLVEKADVVHLERMLESAEGVCCSFASIDDMSDVFFPIKILHPRFENEITKKKLTIKFGLGI